MLARRARPVDRARRSTWSASSSTAPTRTCSTRMARAGEAPNVARLMAMGTAVRARRDGGAPHRHARQPHVDPHRPLPRSPRDPAQRVVRPRDGRAGHHQLDGHVAVGDEARLAAASSRSTTRCTAPGPTRSPRRSTSRATSAPTTRRSTSSAAARCRRSPTTRSASPTPPSGSCARRRTTRGPRSSTTWAPSRPSASGAAHYRDETYPTPTLHVVQLHAHRLGDPRGRPALGDRGRIRPRHRRPPRRGARGASSAPACSTTPRSCSSPTTAWRRTTPPCTRRLGRHPARRRHPLPRRGLLLPLPRRGLTDHTLTVLASTST